MKNQWENFRSVLCPSNSKNFFPEEEQLKDNNTPSAGKFIDQVDKVEINLELNISCILKEPPSIM